MSGFGRALARGLAGGVQGFGVALAKQAEDAREDFLADKKIQAMREERLTGQAFALKRDETRMAFDEKQAASQLQGKTAAREDGQQHDKDILAIQADAKRNKPPTPQSTIAKIEADYRNGLISEQDRDDAKAKHNAGQSFSYTTADGDVFEFGGNGSGQTRPRAKPVPPTALR